MQYLRHIITGVTTVLSWDTVGFTMWDLRKDYVNGYVQDISIPSV